MKGYEASKQLKAAYEQAKNRPIPDYIDDADEAIVFTMHNGNTLGMIRDVYTDDHKIILSGAPKDWKTYVLCTNQEVIDTIADYDEYEVYIRMDGELYPVSEIKNDFLGENDDDEGYNFVDFRS